MFLHSQTDDRAPASADTNVSGAACQAPIWPDLRAGERHGPTPWKRVPAPGGRPWRIAAVIPCFNRHHDVELLLQDLASCDLEGIELTVTLADNDSSPPIASVRMPPRLPIDVVRIDRNVGGSGGFSAAMAHVLQRPRGEPPDFLLLLDSDVRVPRCTLRVMLDALSSHDDLVGVGPELRDPQSGRSYETGGMISRHDGGSYPAVVRDSLPYRLVPCDYIASCGVLVRREAVERTGLFPEAFLYLDDIDWCLALRETTGQTLAAMPGVVVYHPWWWRRVLPGRRYYIARNCLPPLERLGLGAGVRFRRALAEVRLSISLASLGLDELAREHIRGLADAAAGRTLGAGRARNIAAPPTRPISEIGAALAPHVRGKDGIRRVFVHPVLGSWYFGHEDLREQLAGVGLDPINFGLWHSRFLPVLLARAAWAAVRRVLVGPHAQVAVVPLEWSTGWMHGARCFVIAGSEFLEVEPDLRKTLPRAARCALEGLWHACRLWWRGPGTWPLPKVFDQAGTSVSTHGPRVAQAV